MSAWLAALAAGCGGVTGVDDSGAVVPPPDPSPGGETPVDPVTPGQLPPDSLIRVSGDSQSTLVNQTAPQRLVVRVADSLGNPIKNVEVKWTLGGSGTVVPVAPRTDDQGLASATWQLGNAPGAQFVRVEAAGFATTFTATATIQYQSVDAGGFHACAITPSAAVYCWGYNGDGQLGTNSLTNRNVPTPMVGDLTFRQLSGGRYHTCGITLSGIAYCWGANLDGRLGDNKNEPSRVPVQAATPVAFESIGSGWNHTCGLSKAGMAYCWGFNQNGEVGAVIPPADSVAVEVPRPVSGQTFKSLAVGGLHSCAIDLDERAWCWGFNGYGQLGDGTRFNTLNNTVDTLGNPLTGLPVPVQMPVPAFQAIAAGAQHSCALADGTVWCWGDNRFGQLGRSTPESSSLLPVQVEGLPADIASLSAGDFHSCAVTRAGKVWCWGDNRYGQRGAGAAGSSPTPVAVLPERSFRSFSAGETLSCGVTTDGQVYCVGSNLYGQIGDATNADRAVPVPVAYQQ